MKNSKKDKKITTENFVPVPNALAKMDYTKRSFFLANSKDVSILKQETRENGCLLKTTELNPTEIRTLKKALFSILDVDFIIKQFIVNFMAEFTPQSVLTKKIDENGNTKIIHCIEKPTGGNVYYTLSFYFEDFFEYACHPNADSDTKRFIAKEFRAFLLNDTGKKKIFETEKANTYVLAIPYQIVQAEFDIKKYKLMGNDVPIPDFNGKIISLNVHEKLVGMILNEANFIKSNFHYEDKYFASRSWEYLNNVRKNHITNKQQQLSAFLVQNAKIFNTTPESLLTDKIKSDYLDFIAQLDTSFFNYWHGMNAINSYLAIHINKDNKKNTLKINDREFSTLINGSLVHNVEGKLQFKAGCKKEFYKLCNDIIALTKNMKDTGKLTGLKYIPLSITEMTREQIKAERKQNSNKNCTIKYERIF